MKISSLAAVAIAIASSHFAEAHDVRVGDREQYRERSHESYVRDYSDVDEPRGKPGKREADEPRGKPGKREADEPRGKPGKREHVKHNPNTVRVGDIRNHSRNGVPMHKRKDDSSDEDPSLIVGGTSTQVGEYPYYVDLDGCGGSLIAPDVVLSAAHCEDFPGSNSFVGQTVIVGAYDDGEATHGAQEATVTKSFSHPLYAENESLDVMLLQLDRELTIPGPGLILNTQFAVPSDGQMLTVIGLGDTTEGGEGSDQLLQVDVKTVNFNTCNRNYEGEISEDFEICAGGNGIHDSCQGDSGGPIVIKEGSTHRQVGVVSWGEGCARKDLPGVYARVSAAMEWIVEVVCNEMKADAYFCGGSPPTGTPPTGSPPSGGGCTDIVGWVDSYGDGCDYYDGENATAACEEYADDEGTNGKTPIEACCSCQ